MILESILFSDKKFLFWSIKENRIKLNYNMEKKISSFLQDLDFLDLINQAIQIDK